MDPYRVPDRSYMSVLGKAAKKFTVFAYFYAYIAALQSFTKLKPRLSYTALCTNDTMRSIGISHTDPGPQRANLWLPKHPNGLLGATPMRVISLTMQGVTLRITPVNPLPETPPLVVKIVTVSPTYLQRISARFSSLISLL